MNNLEYFAFLFAFILVVFAFQLLIGLVPWYRARAAGVSIGLMQIMFMKFRRVPPRVIVDALIALKQEDIVASPDDFEAHYMAGGHVEAVAKAMVDAKVGGIELDFMRACAIDLAGQDINAVVDGALNPVAVNDISVYFKTIESGEQHLKLHLRLRVNIERVVGGGSQEDLVTQVAAAVKVAAQKHIRSDVDQGLSNLVNDIVDAQLDMDSSMEITNLKIEFKSSSIDRCLV